MNLLLNDAGNQITHFKMLPQGKIGYLDLLTGSQNCILVIIISQVLLIIDDLSVSVLLINIKVLNAVFLYVWH